MAFDTDVFVVGGGPAGLAAAIAARGKGFRVIVADGGAPPIDKPCGEGLLPETLAALRELGVTLPATEGYKLHGVRFVGRGAQAAANFANANGIGLRRPILHQRLIDRSAEAGVRLLWKTPVTGMNAEGVIAGGKLFGAKWIVGADGIQSRVRRWSGLEECNRGSRRFANRQHYRVAPWTNFVEVHWGDHAQAYVTPVDEEEVGVVTVSKHRELREVSLIDKFPELARRLLDAKPVTAERGAVTLMQKLRHVYRGNVALVGDASGSVDAITGEGLRLGFRQAQALAESLAAGDLRGYGEAHRRLMRKPVAMGRLMLLLDGRTRLRERVIRALSSDARLFERLAAVHVGDASRAQVASAGATLGWRFVAA